MFVKIAIGFLAVFLGLFSACAVVVLQTGIGSVYVDNADVTFWLPVPMAVVDLALYFMPPGELKSVREEVAPVKDLVLAAFHELQECPNVTLVEVETVGEMVRLEKKGQNLIVEVDSRSEGKVKVRAPIHSLQRIFRSLAG